jgi:NTE family protein
MRGLAPGQSDSALSRLFTGPHAAKGVVWFSLPGGRPLYRAGQPADTLYFVRAGRLGVVRDTPGGAPDLIGVIKPGEPAGEMALIAGTPHSATVTALRDSEILALSRQTFFAEARKHPDVMAELARLMILRARQPLSRGAAGRPTVFGFVAVSPGVDAQGFTQSVAQAARELGFSAEVIGSEGAHQSTEWFSRIEQANDVVLLTAGPDETDWAHLCARQVDRLFLLGRGDQPAPKEPASVVRAAAQLHRQTDLILIQSPETVRPTGSEAWVESQHAIRHFHVRRMGRDIERMARIITGTSVGLALSGGGARAYAHVGVIRALREAGHPIDFLAGASMGAVVAAGYAAGWDDQEISDRIRAAFVTSNPLGDLTFPMVAMTRGLTVKGRLKQHFGEIDIGDLWLPFLCTSSNLTTAETFQHRKGKVRRALRASVALPGILPPVVMGDDVLVDGAVMCNLPTELMRSWHRGPVVGVDVATAEGLNAQDIARPPSFLRWIASGEWRHGPPIVSILIRAATAPTARETITSHEACDLLIIPRIEGVELRDWRAFEPAVAAGYQAARLALDRLDRPLSRLRLPVPADNEMFG